MIIEFINIVKYTVKISYFVTNYKISFIYFEIAERKEFGSLQPVKKSTSPYIIRYNKYTERKKSNKINIINKEDSYEYVI